MVSVRSIGFLVGLFFTGMLIFSFFSGAYAWMTEPAVESVEHKFHKHAKDVSFSSDGPLGKFDRAQLQRGLKVYQEVCAGCHSLRLISFRNFADLGYSEAEVKALAANWPIEAPAINPDTGEATTRKPTPADPLPNPYLNDTAARAANNNALPPDLSLMSKARHDGGAYLYSLLTGYAPVPADLPKENQPGTGLYYNPYFANLNIAMPAPLTSEGQVTYDDGTKATVSQMSKDVSAFLIWTAEPKMEERKAAGWGTVIFLLIATALAYLAYRNIWHDH